MSEPSGSHPLLLSLDTCGAEGSVVLGRVDPVTDTAEILARATFAGRTHSAQLIPKIAELLAGQKLELSEVQGIVVVRGPGSFTGIRVGLSAAKGLAEALGIKLIALSRLAVLAHVSGFTDAMAVIDAGRNEYYAGFYRRGCAPREMLLTAEEVYAAAREPDAGVLVCESSSASAGSGPDEPDNSLAGRVVRWARVPPPDAADALRLAIRHFREGRFDDAGTLDANYLRRSTFGCGAIRSGGK